MPGALFDNRSTVAAILEAERVPVLKPGEMGCGLSVSPNGLVVRVTVTDKITPERLEVLKAWLGVAVAVLRDGGIPVLMASNGIEATLGAAPVTLRKGAA